MLGLKRNGDLMSFFEFKNAKIAGISICLGEKVCLFDEQPMYYNNNELLCRRLKNTIGFGKRYEAAENTTTADLCTAAALDLIKKMGLSVTEINAIISVTQTPDYYMPGNAHVLHERLELSKDCLALDVELGCSGFVYALFLAYSMISLGMERVLIVAGDTLSKTINRKDRSEAPLFTDSGSACIVEKSMDNSEAFFMLRSDGKGVTKMFQPAGAYRRPSDNDTKIEYMDKGGNIRSAENFFMNGLEVFNFTLVEQPLMLQELLAKCDKEISAVDYFIFHQGNKYIVETLAKSMKIPLEKVPCFFSEYGNQSSASIPGTICAMKINEEKVSNSFVLQGFGIGYSWGGCLLDMSIPLILPPFVYGEDHV